MINEFAMLKSELALATSSRQIEIAARMVAIVEEFCTDFPYGKQVSFPVISLPSSASAKGLWNLQVLSTPDCPSKNGIISIFTPIYRGVVENFGVTSPQRCANLARICGVNIKAIIKIRKEGDRYINSQGVVGTCVTTSFVLENLALMPVKEALYEKFIFTSLMADEPKPFNWYPEAIVTVKMRTAPPSSFTDDDAAF